MMSRVNVGGHSLAVQIDGPENAPWIVLSNSLGATMQMWDPQVAFLAQKYRILRYDTRGHGKSDAPEGPYAFAGLNRDVIALLDYHDIETASFMGLSMGGMTGLGLALDHSDRFERIVCADGRADAPEGFRANWDDRIAKVRSGGLEAIVDGTLQSWFTENWRVAQPDQLSDLRMMVLSNNPAGYIACCQALKELDYLRYLGGISTPLLYVGGEFDMGAAPAVMQEMADNTPGGRYVSVPNAAHVANINAPLAFNKAISEFLEI